MNYFPNVIYYGDFYEFRKPSKMLHFRENEVFLKVFETPKSDHAKHNYKIGK